MLRLVGYNISSLSLKKYCMSNSTVADCASGVVKVMRKTYETVDIPIGPNTAFFDRSSRHWKDTYEWNKYTLLQMQHYANNKLRMSEVLDINEVYKMLDIKARYDENGRRLGWALDAENGDNYVDFGLYNPDFMNDAGTYYWPNGEPFIILNFNAYDISERSKREA